MFQYHKNWMEFWFFVLMVMGIIIALASPSAFISYVIIFIAGFFGGRMIFDKRDFIKFPYYIIIAGFLIGYIIGAYYGSAIAYAVLFTLGGITGYKVFAKGVLKDRKY